MVRNSRSRLAAGESSRFHFAVQLAVLIGTCGLAFACASGSPPPATAPMTQYVVGASDELSIRVLPDPAIERVVKVRPDGKISMDLIGDVDAAGRTIEQIRTDIRDRIAEFRVSPDVTISLESPASTAVAVTGEVNTPRSFPLDREIRVSEAVAMAGGATNLAAASRVRVVRRTGPDAATTYRANLDRIQKGQTSSDVVLAAGDLVHVPPDTMVSVGYAIQRALYPLQVVMQTIAGPLLGFLVR
jgi:polysaccharide export outer membrane protein